MVKIDIHFGEDKKVSYNLEDRNQTEEDIENEIKNDILPLLNIKEKVGIVVRKVNEDKYEAAILTMEQLLNKVKEQDKPLIKQKNPLHTFRTVHDPIHVNVELPKYLWTYIIDTPEFQRLRGIFQLGTLPYVFPSLVHNRFGHSIGVAHLASRWIRRFKKTQPELKITDEEVFCVEAAAVMHDMGHGPFSHAFEHGFVRKLDKEKYHVKWDHEMASCAFARKLIGNMMKDKNNHQLKLEDKHVDMIERMIMGVDLDKELPDEVKGREFLYQIVSNSWNSLDVDKFDYLARDTFYMNNSASATFSIKRMLDLSRVIKGHICFKEKVADSLFSDIFVPRINLHRQIYGHRVAVSLDLMVGEMIEAFDHGQTNQELKISELFRFDDKKETLLDRDEEEFLKRYSRLIDQVLLADIRFAIGEEFEKAQRLLNRIYSRDLYKLAGCIPLVDLPEDKAECSQAVENKKKVLKGIFKNKGLDEQIILHVQKYNYGMGSKNPMEKVYCYAESNPSVYYPYDIENEQALFPSKFEKTVVNIFVRERKYLEKASSIILSKDVADKGFKGKVSPYKSPVADLHLHAQNPKTLSFSP